jgi:hypothetical protein
MRDLDAISGTDPPMRVVNPPFMAAAGAVYAW